MNRGRVPVKLTIEAKRKAGVIVSFGEDPFAFKIWKGIPMLIPSKFVMMTKAASKYWLLRVINIDGKPHFQCAEIPEGEYQLINDWAEGTVAGDDVHEFLSRIEFSKPESSASKAFKFVNRSNPKYHPGMNALILFGIMCANVQKMLSDIFPEQYNKICSVNLGLTKAAHQKGKKLSKRNTETCRRHVGKRKLSHQSQDKFLNQETASNVKRICINHSSGHEIIHSELQILESSSYQDKHESFELKHIRLSPTGIPLSLEHESIKDAEHKISLALRELDQSLGLSGEEKTSISQDDFNDLDYLHYSELDDLTFDRLIEES